MIDGIRILNSALPLLYLAAFTVYAQSFYRDAPWARKIKTLTLLAIVGLHFFYIVLRTIAFRHPPVTTIFEILTVVAFSVAIAYLAIEYRSGVKHTGMFITGMAFIFQAISSVLIRDLTEVPEILRSNLFGIHVGSALLGYAAVTISAVYASLYLMLYHDIKSTRFGIIYKKLPNLEALEKMSFSAFKMAFVFLGLAIAVGLIWLPQALATFSYADPKLIGTVLIWLLYGTGILAKKSGGWKGRKVMILSVWGFGITMVSMMVINVFFSGFHRFV